MDAQLIPPQEDNVGDLLLVSEIFDKMLLLGQMEQNKQSKNLIKILELLCLQKQDTFINSNKTDNLELKYLIHKYQSKLDRLYNFIYKMFSYLHIISMDFNKINKKYIENFKHNYNKYLKLNVGDIVIYYKNNQYDKYNDDKYLCRIKSITSKNYVLEEIYTNFKTFRKNLYGEDCYLTRQKKKPQLELFDKIYIENRKFFCDINKTSKYKFVKYYKNSNGVYVGSDCRTTQAFEFLYPYSF